MGRYVRDASEHALIYGEHQVRYLVAPNTGPSQNVFKPDITQITNEFPGSV